MAIKVDKKSAPEKKVKRKKQNINVSKDAYYKATWKRVARIFVYLLLTVIAVYVAFAATIVRFLPTDNYDDFGKMFVPVKNQTFAGGIVQQGSQVVVNLEEEQGTSTFDRLKQAFTINRNVALVEVQAGPVGRITWVESGLTTVDGTPMDSLLAEKPEGEYLNNEYFAICIEGDCKSGEGLIVPATHIYGEPIVFQSIDEMMNKSSQDIEALKERTATNTEDTVSPSNSATPVDSVSATPESNDEGGGN